MSDGWDIVSEYADTVSAMVETENELRRDIAQMRQTLREILEELRLDDSRHDLQAKIISTPGFIEHP